MGYISLYRDGREHIETTASMSATPTMVQRPSTRLWSIPICHGSAVNQSVQDSNTTCGNILASSSSEVLVRKVWTKQCKSQVQGWDPQIPTQQTYSCHPTLSWSQSIQCSFLQRWHQWYWCSKGIFQVNSTDAHQYTVNFNIPSCSCPDWTQHHHPCKHFFCNLSFTAQWDWNALPQSYLASPGLSLDTDALSTYFSDDPSIKVGEPTQNGEWVWEFTKCKHRKITVQTWTSIQQNFQSEKSVPYDYYIWMAISLHYLLSASHIRMYTNRTLNWMSKYRHRRYG